MDGGRSLGPWTTTERLGKGGNATVWRATREGLAQPVALKVLQTTKTRSERYRRFVQEIEFMRSLGAMPGILPLLDFSLPNRPSGDNPAWLAMAEATPIRGALEDASLETRIAAVAAIAHTLAQLAEDHEAAHRDIKPGNLYFLHGDWLVGDFGLVAVPDKAELTRKSRPLGPAHYTAYEIVLDPSSDPFPADVFSIGKTLWVLATDSTWPPDGHQPAATRGFSIAELTPHPNAGQIDELVDRCTRLHADERPTMRQVAADLAAWLDPPEQLGQLDLSVLRAELSRKMRAELAEANRRGEQTELALIATRRLQELMRPLNDALRTMHPNVQIDRHPGKAVALHITNGLRETGREESVYTYARATRIPIGHPQREYAFTLGTGLELLDDGTLLFRRAVLVGYETFGGWDFNWLPEALHAPVGSIEMGRLIEEGVSELAERMREGIAAFVEQIPER
jgi:hypothetical protein